MRDIARSVTITTMITDIHMHVVPDIDDGAVDLNMSLDMLQNAYNQGVRTIYCTSHNGYEKEATNRYKAQFMLLKTMAKAKFPDLKLYTGCEILCAGEYIDEIIYGLETGVFLQLGNSRYVLTELYPDVTALEAKLVIQRLIDAGWHPILAHAERYPKLYKRDTIKELIELGAKVQINLFSLVEEFDEETKGFARFLVEHKYAHFIGSDAHRSNHRPPRYEKGIEFLLVNCDMDYFEKLCYNKIAEE